MSLTKKKHDIRKFLDCIRSDLGKGIRSDSEKGDIEKKKKKSYFFVNVGK